MSFVYNRRRVGKYPVWKLKTNTDTDIIILILLAGSGRIMKDAYQRGRFERISKAPSTAAIRPMSEHGSHLRSISVDFTEGGKPEKKKLVGENSCRAVTVG